MKIASRKGHVLEKTLNAIINATIAFSRHPSRNSASVYRALRDYKMLKEISDSQLRYISRYIIDKKYVTVERGSNGFAEITVSTSGRHAAKRLSVLDLKPVPLKQWDKKWRFVMFDIPNHIKHVRDAFAGSLKRLGFIHYQKSVFICPHPCEEQLEIIAEYYGIAEYVEILTAERITHEKSFKKSFGL